LRSLIVEGSNIEFLSIAYKLDPIYSPPVGSDVLQCIERILYAKEPPLQRRELEFSGHYQLHAMRQYIAWRE
jgi:hypothetical protein